MTAHHPPLQCFQPLVPEVPAPCHGISVPWLYLAPVSAGMVEVLGEAVPLSAFL